MQQKMIKTQIEVLENKKADLYKQDLVDFLAEVLSRDNISQNVKEKAAIWIAKKNFWEVAMVLGDYMNSDEIKALKNYAENKDFVKNIIDNVRQTMGKMAKLLKTPTIVEFGTSGWRGQIGENFTIFNVHKVARAIVDTMHTEAFLKENGYASFEEVQRKGIVVFRDNRYMGEDFIQAVAQELSAAGIKIYYAGECATGIGSAIVKMLGAAGSINFTPSHNPMSDAGLKFNPADGGPADKNITDLIQARANEYMKDEGFVPAQENFIGNIEKLDAVGMYIDFLEDSKFINIKELRANLLANADNVTLVVDNMHGASRGVVQRILGEEVIGKIDIEFVNDTQDYSFHGVKPEPSAKNQKPLINKLQKSNKKIRIAVALDPDADRIRFADAETDFDMNKASGILFKAAIDKGMLDIYGLVADKSKPGVATTVASSGFAAAIARKLGLFVAEVAVGFKNFRNALNLKQVVMAFEESDGITFAGHTLEKDGFAGFLMILDYALKKQKSLTEIYHDLQEEFGYYYPGKDGKELKDIKIEEWQVLRKKVMEGITNKFEVGDELVIAGQKKKIVSKITLDGVKWVFDDNSWMLIRSSGTESKFRYYYETVGKGNDKLLPDYLKKAGEILDEAIAVASRP